MTLTAARRRAIQGAEGMAATRLGIGRARAAEFSFKVGTDVPKAAPLKVYLRQAADAIRSETSGRVDLVIYPNNQLSVDPAVFSQFRSGALGFFLLSGINVLSALIPKASIYGLGFVFKDDKGVYDALDGELQLFGFTDNQPAPYAPLRPRGPGHIRATGGLGKPA